MLLLLSYMLQRQLILTNKTNFLFKSAKFPTYALIFFSVPPFLSRRILLLKDQPITCASYALGITLSHLSQETYFQTLNLFFPPGSLLSTFK